MTLAMLNYSYLSSLIGTVRVLVPIAGVRLLCPATGSRINMGPVAGQTRLLQKYTTCESVTQ